MTEERLFRGLLVAVFVAAPLTLLSLLRLDAPYGRHARPGWGRTLPARWGWLVMESPSVIAFLVFYARGSRALEAVPLVLTALWMSHYVYRAFVYPFRLGPRRARVPVSIALMSVAYNVVNSYLNATSLSTDLGPAHSAEWLRSPAFLAGLALFAGGQALNRDADRRLRALHEHAAGGYGLPRGGAFEYVACPNYLGEIVQWAGWALCTRSPAGLSFAVFTFANLAPRALAHRRFYRERFPEYPPGRRALIPFVL